MSLEASYTMGAIGCSQQTTPVFLHRYQVDGGPQRKREIGNWLISDQRMEGSLKVTLHSLGQNLKQARWYLSLS